MRKIFPILVFLGLILLSFGCKKSSSNESVQQLLLQGTWFVHYYYDGTDQTLSFAPYTFTFSSGDNVSVTGNSLNLQGSWQVSTSSGTTLTLQFSTSTLIKDTNGAWKVTGNSNDLITMEDDSSTPARQLHFKKS